MNIGIYKCKFCGECFKCKVLAIKHLNKEHSDELVEYKMAG